MLFTAFFCIPPESWADTGPRQACVPPYSTCFLLFSVYGAPALRSIPYLKAFAVDECLGQSGGNGGIHILSRRHRSAASVFFLLSSACSLRSPVFAHYRASTFVDAATESLPCSRRSRPDHGGCACRCCCCRFRGCRNPLSQCHRLECPKSASLGLLVEGET